MRDWHASLTPEERAEISKKQADATLNQIATQGHPAQGTKRSDEQRVILSHAQQNRNNDYTPEIRQRMSEAHIGIKDSDETKKNKAESAKAAWEKRQAAAIGRWSRRSQHPQPAQRTMRQDRPGSVRVGTGGIGTARHSVRD